MWFVVWENSSLFSSQQWLFITNYIKEVIMDAKVFELSIEQQFKLQCLQQEFQDLEREQVINYLLDTMQQIMARDNLIRDLMKNSLF
jgi:hypothetical protein